MTHDGHGRSSDGNSPDESDCPCRSTAIEHDCAEAGCGFCIASRDRRQLVGRALEYHALHGEDATIEGCPCCFS